MTWNGLWAYFGLLAWAVYLGGALAMELVWRPVQEHLPMAQIGVACQQMGRRYRWVALTMLMVAGGSAVAELVARVPDVSLSPGDPYGRTVLVAGACWVTLVGIVGMMAFLAHPALHVRMASDLDPEARAAARARVARAIGRMDRCLRAELVVALVATFVVATLTVGGI